MRNRLMADISNNNDHFDAREYAAAGHRAVAIKCTEGLAFVDQKHRGWCLAAGLQHLSIWHYHFARPDLGTHPHDEADHFLNHALPLAGHRDYLVLDIERGGPGNQGDVPGWCNQFDQRVQAGSRFHTILYASSSTLGQSDKWLAGENRRVWDAAYGVGPSFAPTGYELAARQFTDGLIGPDPHEAAGVGRCDMSLISSRMAERIG